MANSPLESSSFWREYVKPDDAQRGLTGPGVQERRRTSGCEGEGPQDPEERRPHRVWLGNRYRRCDGRREAGDAAKRERHVARGLKPLVCVFLQTVPHDAVKCRGDVASGHEIRWILLEDGVERLHRGVAVEWPRS